MSLQCHGTDVAQECHVNVLIKYISDEITKDEEMWNDRWKDLKSIMGTQKIHSVFPVHDRKVMATLWIVWESTTILRQFK